MQSMQDRLKISAATSLASCAKCLESMIATKSTWDSSLKTQRITLPFWLWMHFSYLPHCTRFAPSYVNQSSKSVSRLYLLTKAWTRSPFSHSWRKIMRLSKKLAMRTPTPRLHPRERTRPCSICTGKYLTKWLQMRYQRWKICVAPAYFTSSPTESTRLAKTHM